MVKLYALILLKTNVIFNGDLDKGNFRAEFFLSLVVNNSKSRE